MDATRRSFLKGILTIAVVASGAMPAFSGVPKIVGDGVHDDWAGLQALFDGEPFSVEGQDFIAAGGRISGGVFSISRELVATNASGFLIRGNKFICAEDFIGNSAITFGAGNGWVVSNNFFDMRGKANAFRLIAC